MMILITYDVAMSDISAGQRRLRKIVKLCTNYGVRVQYSVFECDIDSTQWVTLKAALLQAFDPKVDSLRFYLLGKNWRNHVEHYGAKKAIDIYGDTIII